MHRPLRVLIAAAITVSTFAGASAANASTAPTDPAALTRAAASAHATASAALAGLALPSASASTPRLRAAAAAPIGSSIEKLDTTVRVKVAAKKYDIHVVSTGAKSDRTRITLYLGTQRAQVSVRRLVRVTVLRHGHTHPLLQTTTTFQRFVVMLTGLQSDPLLGTPIHFTTRSAFVAALAHGLAIDGAEVTKEYGALLRFVQMSLDLSMTLGQAAQYASENPTATDFTGVTTVQTTAGSGGYTGTVTLTGTATAFTVAATNTTDASSLTESFDAQAFTMTYTVGGKTYTRTVSLTE